MSAKTDQFVEAKAANLELRDPVDIPAKEREEMLMDLRRDFMRESIMGSDKELAVTASTWLTMYFRIDPRKIAKLMLAEQKEFKNLAADHDDSAN